MDPATNSTKRAILVAEDDSLLAVDIEEAIRRCGHGCVGPVGSLSEVLQLLDTTQIHAAILDVLLRHGEKVYPAVDLLVARGIPFAFVTAYGITHVEPRFARFRTLGKPFLAQDLELLIEELIRAAGPAKPTVPSRTADRTDTANVIIRPPIAWAVAVLAGLALNWLMPLPFVPAAVPAGWLGAMVFALALALVAWAIATISRAGSNVPTSRPTTAIVDTGPYRFTRNPIYLGMVLGLIGLTIAFDNLWLPMMLVPFALVIRYGVVAREEAYLERKFGDVYRRYRARVRRWL